MALEIGDQALEVLAPEPLEHVHLVGEPGQPVGQPVRQRMGYEAAVAAAAAEADGLALEQHDVAAGIVGLGVQRGPQAGEAAADDAQVRVDGPRERGLRLARRQRVEPERPRLGVGVRRTLHRGRRRRRPGDRHQERSSGSISGAPPDQTASGAGGG